MHAAVNGGSGDELGFRFVSGHLTLDFLATLGNRHRDPVERLREPGDLDRWLAAAGIPVDAVATAADLRAARELRETTNRLVRAGLGREAPSTDDVAALNRSAREPTLAPQLGASLERRWVGRLPVREALALVAREAAELLTSPERALIRECAAAPRCSLLYLDRSRGRRRRWCEMERCGSRAKMAKYRHRRAEAGRA